MAAPEKLSEDVLKQLRSLSHKMSNSLEVIIQAQYLLQQSELSPEDEKWAAMIGKAGVEATESNREIRDIIRALSINYGEKTVVEHREILKSREFAKRKSTKQ